MDGTTTTTLKLIIEKGPRAGETLTYPPTSLINIGRVVRGNTITIKDSGISSKHMSIQFDTQLTKWTVSDLDSSNGTVLNGQILKPYVHSVINDGDQIKIGELTSIVVMIEAEAVRPRRNVRRKPVPESDAVMIEAEAVRPRRNVRRQRKCEPEPESESESESVVEIGNNELGLGLGFDGDLGKKEGIEAVKKRNTRSSAKKDVDLSSMRILRSSKKAENLNAKGTEMKDVSVAVAVETKKTRGRRKKVVEEVSADADLEKGKAANVVVPVVGRSTRGRRKGLKVEALEENLNNVKESVQVDEGNEATLDNLSVDNLEKVKENLDANNESALEDVVEKVVSSQEKADESSLKGKEVAEESEGMKDGCDNDRWVDLEKMTLGDFFDYLEVQLPKEIHDKMEKIISDMAEKARQCHEFRLQRNESGKVSVNEAFGSQHVL